MIYKKIIIGVLAVVTLSAPILTSAGSIVDLQARVQSLLSVVAQLQQQLSNNYSVYNNQIGTGINYGNAYTTTRPWWCSTYSDVSFGQYSNRVMGLHNAMGYSVLGTYPTGYYGQLTYSAWQRYCGQVVTPPVVYNTDPSANSNCQSWYDGCNNCSRSYRGGPAMCTLRACFTQGQAYCTGYFGTTTNQPPTISGFSGPTTLNINQIGTWTVQARDPENGQLNYTVTWGDEYNYGYGLGALSPESKTFVQSTSFTHQYSQAGTYTVSIVVRDNAGQEARTTSTVRVNNTATICTLEYSPVCGQPRFYCPVGAYCAQVMPAQKTYSNICQLNADGATLAHYGTCVQVHY